MAAGLFVFGYSSGTWDVAMNVQGAAVEQALGRAIMSRFHAGWSVGTVAGAGAGTAMVALGVPVTVHLLAVALAVAATVARRGAPLPPHSPPPRPPAPGAGTGRLDPAQPARGLDRSRGPCSSACSCCA